MERGAWTDERLDDLAARGESQFELLVSEMRTARTELRELRADMHTELGQLRKDMHTELGQLRADMHTELGHLRKNMHTELGQLRADMHTDLTGVRRDMLHGVIALFGAQVAIFAVLLGQSL
jgi:DNA anti-recombination protein RmuC